jgi:hypothetical protein
MGELDESATGARTVADFGHLTQPGGVRNGAEDRSQVRVVPVGLAHRVGLPLVERLLGEAQHPAGHRNGDVLGGEFTDQRVDL